MAAPWYEMENGGGNTFDRIATGEQSSREMKKTLLGDTLDGQDFFIDLVFYNYILKCFILIDLKTGELIHQDLGQMQMYVNYYTRELMNEGDTPPIGIVLCAEKNDAVVRYTLPENNNQIYASKYFTYLPTEDELKQELRLEDYTLRED